MQSQTLNSNENGALEEVTFSSPTIAPFWLCHVVIQSNTHFQQQ